MFNLFFISSLHEKHGSLPTKCFDRMHRSGETFGNSPPSVWSPCLSSLPPSFPPSFHLLPPSHYPSTYPAADPPLFSSKSALLWAVQRGCMLTLEQQGKWVRGLNKCSRYVYKYISRRPIPIEYLVTSNHILFPDPFLFNSWCVCPVWTVARVSVSPQQWKWVNTKKHIKCDAKVFL